MHYFKNSNSNEILRRINREYANKKRNAMILDIIVYITSFILFLVFSVLLCRMV